MVRRVRGSTQMVVLSCVLAGVAPGCALYDRDLVQPVATLDDAAGASASASAGEGARTRKRTLSYVATEPATGGSRSESQTAGESGDDVQADRHNPKDHAGTSGSDASSPRSAAGRASDSSAMRDRDAANPDAGMPTPVPELREDPRCGDQRGYSFAQTGHCYTPIQDQVTWYVARDVCSQRRAHLAAPTTPEEQAFLASIPRDAELWLGLSKFGAPNYSWVTNESTSFANWEPGAPSSRSEGGALLRMKTGAWFDAAPSERHRGLCEHEDD